MASKQLDESLIKAVQLFYPDNELHPMLFEFHHLNNTYEEWQDIIFAYLKNFNLELNLEEEKYKVLYYIFIAKDYENSLHLFEKPSRRYMNFAEQSASWRTNLFEVCHMINEDFLNSTKTTVEKHDEELKIKLEEFIKVYKLYYKSKNTEKKCSSWKSKLKQSLKYYFLFPYLSNKWEYDNLKKNCKILKNVYPACMDQPPCFSFNDKVFHNAYYTVYTPAPIYEYFIEKTVHQEGDKVYIYKAFERCNFHEKSLTEMFPTA
jgi:hypothetical protein